MKKGLVLAVLLAFVAFLLWTTLSSQKVECEMCVKFGNERNCATASASTEAEAAQSAQTTACGVLAHGMTASIACANTPPVSRQCRVR
ncbi:MAG TPA: hypothetical protein VIP80_01850 [Gemmatimonadales bacterium]|jgi:hypothetical protein